MVGTISSSERLAAFQAGRFLPAPRKIRGGMGGLADAADFGFPLPLCKSDGDYLPGATLKALPQRTQSYTEKRHRGIRLTLWHCSVNLSDLCGKDFGKS